MITKIINNKIATAVLSCFLPVSPLLAQNILTNGNFEAANVGFTSDYSYSPGNLAFEGAYDVVHDPHDSHTAAFSFADHTSGSGLMLAVNAGSNINRVVWSESISVDSGTIFEFSGWAASWGNDGTGHDPNPSSFHIVINGADVGPSFQLSDVNGQWQSFNLPWNSAASGSALIQLRLNSGESFGNDVAFDDFQFSAVPEAGQSPLLSSAALGALLKRRVRRKRATPT